MISIRIVLFHIIYKKQNRVESNRKERIKKREKIKRDHRRIIEERERRNRERRKTTAQLETRGIHLKKKKMPESLFLIFFLVLFYETTLLERVLRRIYSVSDLSDTVLTISIMNVLKHVCSFYQILLNISFPSSLDATKNSRRSVTSFHGIQTENTKKDIIF